MWLSWRSRFDKIVCTGVLHHLPDPQLGLEALRDVMAPGAAMHLQVYALYGRAGIYMLQEYCRRLDIGHSDAEILDLANTLTRLPPAHPLARLLAESPDFRGKDSLADALLNPQDRAYSVPQLLALVQDSGLSFVRWQQQAPYLPNCGSLAETPHASRLAALPLQEQYAVAELYRGDMLRHNLILYREADPAGGELPRFDGDGWLGYIPLRMPESHHPAQAPAARRCGGAAQPGTQRHGYLPCGGCQGAASGGGNRWDAHSG